MTGFQSLEAAILLFLQNQVRGPFLDAVLVPITHLADSGLIWIVFTLVLLVFPKTRKAGLYGACTLICMGLINEVILKHVFARIRPYEVIEGLKCIVQPQKDFSFPSGHTSVSFSCAFAYGKQFPKKVAIILWIFAVLVAFSRLYVGVHYPTDVLGGMVFGIVYGAIGSALAAMLWRKFDQKSVLEG